jgi:hypothetical protein
MEEIGSGILVAALIAAAAKQIPGHMPVDVKQSSNNILHMRSPVKPTKHY